MGKPENNLQVSNVLDIGKIIKVGIVKKGAKLPPPFPLITALSLGDFDLIPTFPAQPDHDY